MRFKLIITTDNAAFADDNAHIEVARILRELANRLVNEDGLSESYPLRDINGNTVGTAKVVS